MDGQTTGNANQPMSAGIPSTPMGDPVIAALHDYRKQIDALIQLAENAMQNINPATPAHGFYGREMALVRTKLQEAKMWAGKCLEVYGSPFPENLRDKA